MKQFAVLGLTALLAACGGGGGDDGPPAQTPPAATAEGFWSGASSTGVSVALAVLENGETFGVYTTPAGSIVGALYGNTSSSGTSLSGSGKDFNIPSRTVGAGSYSGTFTAKSTVNVTTSTGSSFSGKYDPAYDHPASLAALAGTFSGIGVSGTSLVQSTSVTISPSGAITVPASLGCSASGAATPRPSGKNIFNVTVTFSGSSCALGNGATASGVVYYDTATRRVLVMAMNAAKSDGFIYIGQK